MATVQYIGVRFKKAGKIYYFSPNGKEVRSGDKVIVEECIPHIDAKFRTIADRKHRAVCGLSMGGGHTRRLAFLHPDDLSRLGLSTGDAIWVRTELGRIRFTASADIGVKPGVVHIYHDDPDGHVNRLIPDTWTDPISGFPGFRSLRCAVDKAEKEVSPV